MPCEGFIVSNLRSVLLKSYWVYSPVLNLVSYRKPATFLHLCEVDSLSSLPSESIVLIDQSFEDVLSVYRWHINYLHFDNDAIRIEYELTPPIPIPENEDDILATFTDIWGSAIDNLGNKYQSAGGAFGLSDDKMSTQGVISFVPLPIEEVASIKFLIDIGKNGIGFDSIEFSASLRNSSRTSDDS